MGARYNSKRYKTVSRTEALLVVTVSLFIGTIFTFGMQYWNKPFGNMAAHIGESICHGHSV